MLKTPRPMGRLPLGRRAGLAAALAASVLAGGGTAVGLRRVTATAPRPARSAATEAAIATLQRQGRYASLRAAFDTARYAVHPSTDGRAVSGARVANNPAQHYQATFTPAGLELAGRDGARPWRVGMALSAIGRADATESVSPGAVTTDGARVTLARARATWR